MSEQEEVNLPSEGGDQEEDFVTRCRGLRKQIKIVAERVKSARDHSALSPYARPQLPQVAQQGEMIANVILAYRHLEDAAMRLGKAIQAYDGGVSVYDKTEA